MSGKTVEVNNCNFFSGVVVQQIYKRGNENNECWEQSPIALNAAAPFCETEGLRSLGFGC